MSGRESSVLSFSDSGESSQDKQPLDVADVPDRVLEALHYARQLQLRGADKEVTEIAAKIEELLAPIPTIMAAAAQLAEVA
jgi:hypothetical protein